MIGRILSMLSNRFESLFTGLTRAFVRYDDAPRTPAELSVLSAAWLDLDDHRNAIRQEVKAMGVVASGVDHRPPAGQDSVVVFQVSHLAP